jgi:virulence-associated protein VagC
MPTTHSSRFFTNGTATTLYLTIPARLAADSQFPFSTDDPVTVTIDGDRLVVTPAAEAEDR